MALIKEVYAKQKTKVMVEKTKDEVESKGDQAADKMGRE